MGCTTCKDPPSSGGNSAGNLRALARLADSSPKARLAALKSPAAGELTVAMRRINTAVAVGTIDPALARNLTAELQGGSGVREQPPRPRNTDGAPPRPDPKDDAKSQEDAEKAAALKAMEDKAEKLIHDAKVVGVTLAAIATLARIARLVFGGKGS